MAGCPVGSINVRPETGTLYLDFRYRRVRCREQTALPDTPANRKQVAQHLKRIERAIADGSFVYAEYFPDSARAAVFSPGAVRGPGFGIGIPMAPEQAGATGASTAPAAITPLFSEFAQTWFTEMTPQWRRTYQENVRAMLDRDLLPRFGAMALAAIAKADVLAFRAELAQRPGKKGTLGAARINKIMCVSRQILNEAADRYGLVPAFRSIKPLKMKKSDVQPFSLAEVQRILATIRDDYRNYLTTRFFTGLRSGEINALTWEHIDRERGLILVRQTVAHGRVEQGAKTLGSIRDIPMLPMVRAAIEDQWQQRDPEVPWVFPTRDGGPIDANNFSNRIWLPLLRYLKLAPRRPYQTRHTAATLMLAAGENPEWIAKVLGHSNTEMLFKVYSRFVPNLTRRDGLALAGLLEQRFETYSAPPTSVTPFPDTTEGAMTPPN